MENSRKALRVGNYILKQPHIGEGSFGKVYLCKNVLTEKIYAVKSLNLKKIEEKKSLKDKLVRELKITAKISHPNIVKFYDLLRTQNNFYIFVEYCDGENLQKILNLYLNKFKAPPSLKLIQYFTKQIASALSHMNGKGINSVHRDIKLENIMLTFDNFEYSEINDKNDKNKKEYNKQFLEGLKVDQTMHDMDSLQNIKNNIISKTENKETLDNFLLSSTVKLIDLGLARELREEGTKISLCGSPITIAPELWDLHLGESFPHKIEYYNKVDIWSFGCVVFQLVTGTPPFIADDYYALHEKLKVGDYIYPRNRPLSLEELDFINGLLQYEPEERFTWQEILNHPFLIKNIGDFIPLNQTIIDDSGDIVMNAYEKKKLLDTFYLSINTGIQNQKNEIKQKISISEDNLTMKQSNQEPICEERHPDSQMLLSDTVIDKLLDIIYIEIEVEESEVESGYILINYKVTSKN
jgi:serine/threonine protein kinase